MEHQTRRGAILKNELNIKGMHVRAEIKTTVLQFMLESFIFFFVFVFFFHKSWLSNLMQGLYCMVEVRKN